MTTNVYDGDARYMATDSRWSIEYGKYLLYVDDMQFDKIELYEETAFMFAGKGWGVQAWKDWIRTRPVDASAQPPVDGISLCIVNVPSGQVRFSERQDIVKDGAFFAGTGARHAFLCWDKNRDAHRSVESAKLVDHCTGGEVKFLKLRTGEHNLSYPKREVTLQMVGQAIEERGMVIQVKADVPAAVALAPFKLKDVAAANDSELVELKAKVASGELSPEAPCDGMHSEWTDDQKSRLQGALSSVFGWK